MYDRARFSCVYIGFIQHGNIIAVHRLCVCMNAIVAADHSAFFFIFTVVLCSRLRRHENMEIGKIGLCCENMITVFKSEAEALLAMLNNKTNGKV